MIELLDDARAYAELAGRLIDDDVRHTVLATVLHGILAGEYTDPPPQFAVVRDAEGTVTGAVQCTPPHGLLATALQAPSDAVELIDAWTGAGRDVVAIMAPAATARALGAALARTGRGTPRLHVTQALHVVMPDEVRDPPRPAPGRLRPARATEADWIGEWELAFAAEAGLVITSPDWVRARARARLQAGRTYLWEDDGPRSLAGHTPTVAGTGRIGPVYTPPEHRSLGYASSAVAALTRRRLAAGARRMTLFTDLANPTSNRIYADVGYRRIADYEHYDVV